jgi:predicted Zn-dependent peptidase
MSNAYSLETLPNGLQVLKVPREGTEAVTASFLFRAGSRYEDKRTNGLAHFNEHMAFKGGKEYPDYKAVTEAFDKIGAISNAFTGSEVTGFWAKSRAANVLTFVDVFSDVLTATAYDPKELDKERGVIIEEINMYEDDPASSALMELEAAAFPGQPLGRSTLGPKENIKRFTPDDFRKYESTHQTPDRCVLVLAGKVDGIDDAKLKKLLERFSGTSDIEPVAPKTEQTEPNLKVKHKKTEQTHLGVAVRAPSLADRKLTPVFQLFSQVLGGTMSSRLFTEVREKQGLAYYVRAVPDQYSDTGNLVISAGLRHEKAAEALAAILTEVKRLADGEITDDELVMHKDSLLGRLALRWEDSMALADFYGEQQLLLGDIVNSTEQKLKDLTAVTKDQLIAFGQSLVDDTKLNAALIGPHEDAAFKKALTFG